MLNKESPDACLLPLFPNLTFFGHLFCISQSSFAWRRICGLLSLQLARLRYLFEDLVLPSFEKFLFSASNYLSAPTF
jgi:hypothetical protein